MPIAPQLVDFSDQQRNKLNLEKLFKKNWGKALPLFFGALLVGAGLLFSKVGQQSERGIEILPAEEGSAEQNLRKTIFVDVAGAVINPGVYELPQGARVNDLLIAAGGLSGEADREWVELNLNRAQKLVDGVKVYIPSETEVVLGESSGVSSRGQGLLQGSAGQPYFGVVEESTGLININTASLEELDSLPGIGPAYALRIVDYRKGRGGFKSIEEIKNISGIGEKTFEKIKDKITAP